MAVIQRFGGALNLNVHVHALVLDGVFARDRTGVVVFHPTPRLTALDVAEVLAAVEPRVKRLLDRDNDVSAPDAWAEEAPVMAGIAAASVHGTVALGRRRGARARPLSRAFDRPIVTTMLPIVPPVARRYRDLTDADGELRADAPVSEREARLAGQVLRVVMRDLDPGR